MNELRHVMWFDLFSEVVPGTLQVRRDFNLVRRRGCPFLYLPTNRRAALRALELYPAQSGRARLAKRLFAFGLRLGRPELLGADKFAHAFSPKDSFARYLSRLVGLRESTVPEFAVLAGNPNAPGRRFVFLLFDAANNPVAVVKAGYHEEARALIKHEANLLRALPGQVAGVPRLRDGFSSERGEAFAMEFITGESPKGDVSVELERIFRSWLDSSRQVALRELRAWQRLMSAASVDLPASVVSLSEAAVHPTLMHGDFAPWNVKVANGRWTVLDWERGEGLGVPAWDWFHFLVQPLVLVRRETASQVMARVEMLFASAEFLRYATLAKIGGYERGLFAAYVAYCLRVTRQTEGIDRLIALEAAIRKRWLDA